MTTGARTLQLLSLLQSHRHWSGDELARRLEVSVRTLRRDVERLRDLGYPVHSVPGAAGGYRLAAGAALPPLVLDDEEAVALAVGLQLGAHAAVAGIADSSVRALSKLTQVMPRRLIEQVEALQAATVSPTWSTGSGPVETTVLTTLARACRDDERVALGYTAANGARTERTVEPLRLVRLGQRWYLAAYDLTRHDWRSFRLDRISSVTGTGARFRPRQLPATDAAEFVRAAVRGPAVASYQVEVVVEDAAEQVTARIGRWAQVEPEGPDRCRVRMTADSLDWVAFALGETGARFTVVGPPELGRLLADWADRFAQATGMSASAGER
jgi:predicted DNA-binding transcriptional regulator YafY